MQKAVLFRSTGLSDPSKEDMHISHRTSKQLGITPTKTTAKVKNMVTRSRMQGWRTNGDFSIGVMHNIVALHAICACIHIYICINDTSVNIFCICICCRYRYHYYYLSLFGMKLCHLPADTHFPRFCCPTGVLQCPAWDRNHSTVGLIWVWFFAKHRYLGATWGHDIVTPLSCMLHFFLPPEERQRHGWHV